MSSHANSLFSKFHKKTTSAGSSSSASQQQQYAQQQQQQQQRPGLSSNPSSGSAYGLASGGGGLYGQQQQQQQAGYASSKNVSGGVGGGNASGGAPSSGMGQYPNTSAFNQYQSADASGNPNPNTDPTQSNQASFDSSTSSSGLTPASVSGGGSGSSVSSSVFPTTSSSGGHAQNARTLSTALGVSTKGIGGYSPSIPSPNPQQGYGQQQQQQQQQQAYGQSRSGGQAYPSQNSAASEARTGIDLSGIPLSNDSTAQSQVQTRGGQAERVQSVTMMDVSGLNLGPESAGGSRGMVRQLSDTEERMRDKVREAQEQAAQAQAALQYASQQARVATINAAAAQAALEQSAAQTGNTQMVEAAAQTAKPTTARKTAGRYALADFAIERTLGTGSFGRVHLVRSKHNGRYYAVKVLAKEKVVKMKQVEHTNSEREMLVRVRHPFLVNLWGTFHDVNNLYMVMDFVAGGELFSLLRKSQRFPNSVAKFYAAEVALAIDYLHSLDIIYRDLKPENILLGADGHIKVTDLGFAKYVPDITWTLCGTPDYLAPEVVQSKGYNKSVDWYAVGVLIFEMLAGYPPFFTEDGNPMKLYEKIIAGKVRYPTYFDPLAKDLLKNLLTGDLTKRFGNLRNGSADIFSHAWFAEVDWDKLYQRNIPSPYQPQISGDGDASQFDRYAEADTSQYGKAGTSQYDHLFPDF